MTSLSPSTFDLALICQPEIGFPAVDRVLKVAPTVVIYEEAPSGVRVGNFGTLSPSVHIRPQ